MKILRTSYGQIRRIWVGHKQPTWRNFIAPIIQFGFFWHLHHSIQCTPRLKEKQQEKQISKQGQKIDFSAFKQEIFFKYFYFTFKTNFFSQNYVLNIYIGYGILAIKYTVVNRLVGFWKDSQWSYFPYAKTAFGYSTLLRQRDGLMFSSKTA